LLSDIRTSLVHNLFLIPYFYADASKKVLGKVSMIKAEETPKKVVFKLASETHRPSHNFERLRQEA